jgi:hypothetical protein
LAECVVGVSLVVIVAEFRYWDYGEYSKTAMQSRPEIKNDELERIARLFNVKVEAKKVETPYRRWSSPVRLPIFYRRVDVLVSGEHACDVKGCVDQIFKLYGKPDEVPKALFGSKKTGKKIVDEVLRDFDQTSSSGSIR